MDPLSAAVDRALEPALPAEDSSRVATEQVEDPDPDRLDRKVWLAEFRASPPCSL